jgi:nitrogen regulatory protein P-II 1
MQLLVAVINQVEALDDVLSGFLELGITGATIINSEGMARILTHDIPLFAGIQTLISRSRAQNYTIFSVIDDDEKVDAAFAVIQDVCGNLKSPGTGIVFTIPISRAEGVAPELGGEAEL